MLQTIQLDSLSGRVESDAATFRAAYPFQHLVFDDLLMPEFAARAAAAFPREEWSGWRRNAQAVQDKFQPKKMTCDRMELIPAPLDQLIGELNSGPFIDWLERVTGIPNLLPDSQLFGGGLHYSGPGGMLKPHIDFHYGKNRLLHRRLNLLVYFNSDWLPEYNGALELWDQDNDCIAKEVYPDLGRAVLFVTDSRSLHGFSKPLQVRSRHSVALYYYTVEAPAVYGGDFATHWRRDANGRSSGLVRARNKMLRGVARVLGGLAWRLNSVSNKVESLAGRDFA